MSTSRRTRSVPLRALLAASLVAAVVASTGSAGASPPTLAAKAGPLGLQCSESTPAGAPAFTFCTGELASFDGIGLDTDLSLPANATGPLPTIVMLHGWSGDKTDWETDSLAGGSADRWHWNNVWFVSHGWAVVNYTARGFMESCGTQDQDANCADGYTHLADRRFEGRDSQTILGKLVDAGIADPAKLAATGGSYGGGQTWLLATSLPWHSPQGTKLRLAAGVAKYPWTDLEDSLTPNGRATDRVDQSASHTVPFGVPKASYISGLYAVGRAEANGRYDQNPDHPGTNLDLQYALVQSGEPYSTKPDTQAIIDSFPPRSPYHADAYLDAVHHHTVREVPVMSINGFTDPLFPPVQTLQMFRKLKAADPRYPITMAFGDVGHSNAQNPAAQWHPINRLAWRFLQANVMGRTRLAPKAQAYVFRTHCPVSQKEQLPLAGTWGALTRGVALATGAGSQGITSADQNPDEGRADDPIASAGCLVADDSQRDPAHAYWSWKPPTGGFPLLGLPTVAFHYDLSGNDATVVLKLWDVKPNGSKTMVTRGVYRLSTDEGDPASGTVRTQLFGNDWLFPQGHVIQLQIGQQDSPFARPDNEPSSIQVSQLHVRFPTHRAGTLTLQPT